MDTKLEVVVLPVTDVDKTKQFYGTLGWREDADLTVDDTFRVVQMTPPGSPTSVISGKGVTDQAPGSAQDLLLEPARAGRGLRRPRPVELSHRRLPELPDRPVRRHGVLLARPR